jgi:plastocyanin
MVISRLQILGWGVVVALAAGCGGGDGGGPDDDGGGPRVPVTHAVTIDDGFFFPEDITIARGDSVLWTWAVNDDHSVTSGTDPDDPSEEPRLFDSGIRSSGNFGHRFNQLGGYSYFCREHWDMNMTGSVTVQQPIRCIDTRQSPPVN